MSIGGNFPPYLHHNVRECSEGHVWLDAEGNTQECPRCRQAEGSVRTSLGSVNGLPDHPWRASISPESQEALKRAGKQKKGAA